MWDSGFQNPCTTKPLYHLTFPKKPLYHLLKPLVHIFADFYLKKDPKNFSPLRGDFNQKYYLKFSLLHGDFTLEARKISNLQNPLFLVYLQILMFFLVDTTLKRFQKPLKNTGSIKMFSKTLVPWICFKKTSNHLRKPLYHLENPCTTKLNPRSIPGSWVAFQNP